MIIDRVKSRTKIETGPLQVNTKEVSKQELRIALKASTDDATEEAVQWNPPRTPPDEDLFLLSDNRLHFQIVNRDIPPRPHKSAVSHTAVLSRPGIPIPRPVYCSLLRALLFRKFPAIQMPNPNIEICCISEPGQVRRHEPEGSSVCRPPLGH